MSPAAQPEGAAGIAPASKAALFIIYVLYLFATGIYGGALLVAAGIFGVIGACFVRSSSRRRGDALGEAHADWQVKTFWIACLIAMAGLASLLALFYFIGTHDSILQSLEGIIDNTDDPFVMLSRIWDLKVSKLFVFLVIFFAALEILWPLTRTIKGLLALVQNDVPEGLGTRHWVSLGIAVAIVVLCWFTYGSLAVGDKV